MLVYSKLSYAGGIQGFFVDASHISNSGENQRNRGRKKKMSSEGRSVEKEQEMVVFQFLPVAERLKFISTQLTFQKTEVHFLSLNF